MNRPLPNRPPLPRTWGFFSEQVSQDVGSSFQDHPGYFRGKNCVTNAKITG